MDRDTDGNEGDVPRGMGAARGAPAGILRVDLGKLRRPSMDIKCLSQIEPASPQPSVDRLSVTFADGSLRSERVDTSPRAMEKVHFPSHTDDENSEEEEYSASVTAIMQRRASTRRSKRRSGRRGSSPFSPDILPETENGRRRSSVFTTSSGDTAITMEDSFTPTVTQEQIFENIKLHKEVLSSVKMQPWNMRKKLRLVAQAKSYIKRHEGALQERLAQSHSTKDMLARCNIVLIKKWQQMKREAANLSNWLIPWELRIKEIESHFGSVVASYFIFLRWLFWVNIVIAVILVGFVAVPEMLIADFSKDPDRKAILPEDRYNSTNFLTLWDFEGVFKYSAMFYGWYTDKDFKDKGFRLPLAYFFTGLSVYVYSFVATLRKMAKNSRMSKLSEKEDECIFSWKLFTGWDYMIGNAETAHNRVASIVMSFKEALLEEAEKKREAKSWKLIGSRILVNTGVLSLLALSAFAVVKVVDRSNEQGANNTTWRRNEITVVMSLISLSFPIFFEMLGYFEHYHPRKQLRLQLARIMVLNLLNLYSLIFALIGKIDKMTDDLKCYKLNSTHNPLDLNSSVPTLTSSLVDVNSSNCYSICEHEEVTAANLLGATVANWTRTVLPTVMEVVGTSKAPLFTPSDLTEHLSTRLQQDFDRVIRSVSKTIANNATTIAGSLPFTVEDVFKVDLTHFKDKLREFLEEITDDQKWDDVTETVPGTTTMTYEMTSEATVAELTTFMESLTTTTMSSGNSSCRMHCDVVVQDCLKAKGIINRTDYAFRSRLRSLCWETMFGQELMKLTIMDLVMTVLSTLAIDFLRGLFVRYVNGWWCWDLEKRFPQYGDFKVAENILHLVNNQGMVWMGMFFSPGLVVLNVLKLYVMMYLRSWAVLTCNVPHEIIFRASRSNNFYFALLLMMLFLCVLPVGYTMVWLEPSWHCGPFSTYKRIFHIFTNTIRNALPSTFHKILDYIASPGIVIPLLMLLVLIIYYLISLTNALRESNNDLKVQLRRERTEERRKMFQIADKRRRAGSTGSGEMNPFGKWKKLLQGMPGGKSFDDTPRESAEVTPVEKEKPDVGKKVLSKFIFRALKSKKPSISEDDDSGQPQDDGTDTEQHESLPDDAASFKEAHKQKRTRPTRLESGESGERHVKIRDRIASYHKRRDTIESQRSPLNESRKDSVNSNWSDNIPVITISKTESSECILETQTEIEAVAQKLEKYVPKNHTGTIKGQDLTAASKLKGKKKEEILQRARNKNSALNGVGDDLKKESEGKYKNETLRVKREDETDASTNEPEVEREYPTTSVDDLLRKPTGNLSHVLEVSKTLKSAVNTSKDVPASKNIIDTSTLKTLEDIHVSKEKDDNSIDKTLPDVRTYEDVINSAIPKETKNDVPTSLDRIDSLTSKSQKDFNKSEDAIDLSKTTIVEDIATSKDRIDISIPNTNKNVHISEFHINPTSNPSKDVPSKQCVKDNIDTSTSKTPPQSPSSSNSGERGNLLGAKVRAPKFRISESKSKAIDIPEEPIMSDTDNMDASLTYPQTTKTLEAMRYSGTNMLCKSEHKNDTDFQVNFRKFKINDGFTTLEPSATTVQQPFYKDTPIQDDLNHLKISILHQFSTDDIMSDIGNQKFESPSVKAPSEPIDSECKGGGSSSADLECKIGNIKIEDGIYKLESKKFLPGHYSTCDEHLEGLHQNLKNKDSDIIKLSHAYIPFNSEEDRLQLNYGNKNFKSFIGKIETEKVASGNSIEIKNVERENIVFSHETHSKEHNLNVDDQLIISPVEGKTTEMFKDSEDCTQDSVEEVSNSCPGGENVSRSNNKNTKIDEFTNRETTRNISKTVSNTNSEDCNLQQILKVPTENYHAVGNNSQLDHKSIEVINFGDKFLKLQPEYGEIIKESNKCKQEDVGQITTPWSTQMFQSSYKNSVTDNHMCQLNSENIAPLLMQPDIIQNVEFKDESLKLSCANDELENIQTEPNQSDDTKNFEKSKIVDDVSKLLSRELPVFHNITYCIKSLANSNINSNNSKTKLMPKIVPALHSTHDTKRSENIKIYDDILLPSELEIISLITNSKELQSKQLDIKPKSTNHKSNESVENMSIGEKITAKKRIKHLDLKCESVKKNIWSSVDKTCVNLLEIGSHIVNNVGQTTETLQRNQGDNMLSEPQIKRNVEICDLKSAELVPSKPKSASVIGRFKYFFKHKKTPKNKRSKSKLHSDQQKEQDIKNEGEIFAKKDNLHEEQNTNFGEHNFERCSENNKVVVDEPAALMDTQDIYFNTQTKTGYGSPYSEFPKNVIYCHGQNVEKLQIVNFEEPEEQYADIAIQNSNLERKNANFDDQNEEITKENLNIGKHKEDMLNTKTENEINSSKTIAHNMGENLDELLVISEAQKFTSYPENILQFETPYNNQRTLVKNDYKHTKHAKHGGNISSLIQSDNNNEASAQCTEFFSQLSNTQLQSNNKHQEISNLHKETPSNAITLQPLKDHKHEEVSIQRLKPSSGTALHPQIDNKHSSSTINTQPQSDNKHNESSRQLIEISSKVTPSHVQTDINHDGDSSQFRETSLEPITSPRGLSSKVMFSNTQNYNKHEHVTRQCTPISLTSFTYQSQNENKYVDAPLMFTSSDRQVFIKPIMRTEQPTTSKINPSKHGVVNFLKSKLKKNSEVKTNSSVSQLVSSTTTISNPGSNYVILKRPLFSSELISQDLPSKSESLGLKAEPQCAYSKVGEKEDGRFKPKIAYMHRKRESIIDEIDNYQLGIKNLPMLQLSHCEGTDSSVEYSDDTHRTSLNLSPNNKSKNSRPEFDTFIEDLTHESTIKVPNSGKLSKFDKSITSSIGATSSYVASQNFDSMKNSSNIEETASHVVSHNSDLMNTTSSIGETASYVDAENYNLPNLNFFTNMSTHCPKHLLTYKPATSSIHQPTYSSPLHPIASSSYKSSNSWKAADCFIYKSIDSSVCKSTDCAIYKFGNSSTSKSMNSLESSLPKSKCFDLYISKSNDALINKCSDFCEKKVSDSSVDKLEVDQEYVLDNVEDDLTKVSTAAFQGSKFFGGQAAHSLFRKSTEKGTDSTETTECSNDYMDRILSFDYE